LLNVIDCTLRDGGYYNQWQFNDALVDKYLKAIAGSGVDIVEIGFRFLPKDADLGNFAYSTDQYLSQLSIPSNLQVAVMINAKDFVDLASEFETTVTSVFVHRHDSPVEIVRIAARLDELDVCRQLASELNRLGYRVFLNLMQVDSVADKALCLAIESIKRWNSIEVFYFADSFGSMSTKDVGRVVDLIRSEWGQDIGIHAHDNKGHALANTISAIDAGANYVDATILGMGRGAGNAKMENLLVELTDRGLSKYHPDAIFPLALQEFSVLQAQYKWGSSLYYYLSAVHGIHPTYIQEMLEDGRYDIGQILSVINTLKTKVSSSYSLENLLQTLSASTGYGHGSWSAKNWAKNKEVLVIGSGPSSKQYLEQITQYIYDKKPIVLCLNINRHIPQDLVDAYIACHETRIAIEFELYTDISKPIILPLGRMPNEIQIFLSGVHVLDYGLQLDSQLSAHHNGCTLDKPLVLIYSLCMLSASGANKVALTGVDGYQDENPKQQEMVKELNNFSQCCGGRFELYAITPTSYPIKEKLII